MDQSKYGDFMKKNESTDRVVSSSPILTLIEYKESKDRIGHYIHWKITKYR